LPAGWGGSGIRHAAGTHTTAAASGRCGVPTGAIWATDDNRLLIWLEERQRRTKLEDGENLDIHTHHGNDGNARATVQFRRGAQVSLQLQPMALLTLRVANVPESLAEQLQITFISGDTSQGAQRQDITTANGEQVSVWRVQAGAYTVRVSPPTWRNLTLVEREVDVPAGDSAASLVLPALYSIVVDGQALRERRIYYVRASDNDEQRSEIGYIVVEPGQGLRLQHLPAGAYHLRDSRDASRVFSFTLPGTARVAVTD
jgi:hypothetical protein